MKKVKRPIGPHARVTGKLTITDNRDPKKSRYTRKIVNQKGAFGS